MNEDIYALYLRACCTSSMTWMGPEPSDAPGQLAIVLGRQDDRIGGNPIKTRPQVYAEIAKYDAIPRNLPSSRLSSRPRVQRRRRRA